MLKLQNKFLKDTVSKKLLGSYRFVSISNVQYQHVCRKNIVKEGPRGVKWEMNSPKFVWEKGKRKMEMGSWRSPASSRK